MPPDPAPESRPTEIELRRSATDQRLYIEQRDWIRIRVEEEHWDDSSPMNGKAPPGQSELPPGVHGAVNPAPAIVTGKAPYSLIVSACCGYVTLLSSFI